MSRSFRVLRAEEPAEWREWVAILDRQPRIDPFSHPAYLELFRQDGELARCAVQTTAEHEIIHAFMQRRIGHGGDASDELAERTDTVGPPYGWSGPIVSRGDPDREDLVAFNRAWQAWAADAGVVSDYQTFCPLDETASVYPGDVVAKLPVAMRSLQPDEGAIMQDYRYGVRRYVKRARRTGLTVEFDEEGRELEAFLDIYYETMRRRNAAERYFFPRSFFEGIIAGLPGRFVFGHVRDGGAIVSTELALVSARSAFYYLGGTRSEAFPDHPNELLKHEFAMWGRERGLQWYLLGGGVSGTDSLFEYKRSFAPSGVVDLQVGRWVLDRSAYDRLVEARDMRGPRANPDFFPAYRAP